MEMAMTKDEIISSWKNAISSKKQVGILADLNDCPKSEIVRILYEGGGTLRAGGISIQEKRAFAARGGGGHDGRV